MSDKKKESKFYSTMDRSPPPFKQFLAYYPTYVEGKLYLQEAKVIQWPPYLDARFADFTHWAYIPDFPEDDRARVDPNWRVGVRYAIDKKISRGD
jgi:hypothetical protein